MSCRSECEVSVREALSEPQCDPAVTYNRTKEVSTSIIIVWPRTSYSNTVIRSKSKSPPVSLQSHRSSSCLNLLVQAATHLS